MRTLAFTTALALVTGLVTGCAEVDVPLDGDPQVKAEDALVAVVGPDGLVGPGAGGAGGQAGQGGGGPGGAGGEGPVGGAGGAAGGEGGCAPGARLGLCSVCDASGEPSVPTSDDACPDVDCGQEARYARTELADGVVVCTATQASIRPGVPRCLAPDLCQTDPAVLCGPPTAEEVARADGCQALQGCEGATPPSLQAAPDGAQCNTFGTCQAGTCSVSPGCGAFAGPSTVRYCQEGVDGANAFCEFFVDGPNGNSTCDQFCQSFGTFCLAAFRDRNNTCEPEGGARCDEGFDDQICRCVLP